MFIKCDIFDEKVGGNIFSDKDFFMNVSSFKTIILDQKIINEHLARKRLFVGKSKIENLQ
jgi:predicted secreted protein